MKSLKILNSLLALSSMFVRWLHVGSLKLNYGKLWRRMRHNRAQPTKKKLQTLKLFISFFFKSFNFLIFILIACKLFSIEFFNRIRVQLKKGVYIIQTAYYSCLYIVGNFSLII